MEFLNEIFENDQQRIDLIQEIMGACLFYEKYMQYLVIFLGNGANGKSILASTIRHMLGDNNVSSIAFDQLSGNRFSKQNLDKKLLNISSEINVSKMYSTSDLKTLTGGDAVEVEKKFRDSYTAEIYSKYLLLANDMIQTDDYSDGFYRRLMIIPFDVHFIEPDPENEEEGKHYINPYVEGELFEELPGIFNFALEGYYRLWNNNFIFSKSDACKKVLEQYKKEHNKIEAFFEDCICINEESCKSVVKTSELYKEFSNYCRKKGFKCGYSNKQFHSLFQQMIDEKNLDVKKVKRNGSEVYKGIKLEK